MNKMNVRQPTKYELNNQNESGEASSANLNFQLWKQCGICLVGMAIKVIIIVTDKLTSWYSSALFKFD